MIFVIAEIGINHNGNLEIAKKLIEIAKNAGCNAVKFQKRTVEKVYPKDVLDSPRESPWGNTNRDQKLGLEFGKKEYDKINEHCLLYGIDWFASSWDLDSQSFLCQYDLKYNKIASAMITNSELLKTVAKEKKHTFISTGMSTMKDISKAVKIFKTHNCPFELMHSHSAYPMPESEANLHVINTLKNKFHCEVGYSGHEAGATDVSVPAIMLGASSLERHVTLNRTFYGHDQAASLEPVGLRRLVRDIRGIEKILGDGKKRVWDSELPSQRKLRQKFL